MWDEFYSRFQFVPSGGRPERAIREPSPSVTFDISQVWDASRPGHSDAAIRAVDASARRAFLAGFGEDVELLILDWQHDAFRLRPGDEVPAPTGGDGFPLLPTVVPDGDYYIYATLDLAEGTFGHPWEESLCVFGPIMSRTLGAELRTWLPVLREQRDGQPIG
ncbi:hypothetical protein HDC94_001415 [Leifsonia sp. AK011]|nr:hypothetical protein [Leifsonia sp. AK011]